MPVAVSRKNVPVGQPLLDLRTWQPNMHAWNLLDKQTVGYWGFPQEPSFLEDLPQLCQMIWPLNPDTRFASITPLMHPSYFKMPLLMFIAVQISKHTLSVHYQRGFHLPESRLNACWSGPRMDNDVLIHHLQVTPFGLVVFTHSSPIIHNQQTHQNLEPYVSRRYTNTVQLYRPHHLHALQRCGLLLQMSHVAWPVCVCLFSIHKSYTKMGEPIEMSFALADSCASGSKKPLLNGVMIRRIYSNLQGVTRWWCGRLPNYFGYVVVVSLVVAHFSGPTSLYQMQRNSIPIVYQSVFMWLWQRFLSNCCLENGADTLQSSHAIFATFKTTNLHRYKPFSCI